MRWIRKDKARDPYAKTMSRSRSQRSSPGQGPPRVKDNDARPPPTTAPETCHRAHNHRHSLAIGGIIPTRPSVHFYVVRGKSGGKFSKPIRPVGPGVTGRASCIRRAYTSAVRRPRSHPTRDVALAISSPTDRRWDVPCSKGCCSSALIGRK